MVKKGNENHHQKLMEGAVLRWQRNTMGRPLSPPQIHQKNIWTLSKFYKTTSECQQRISGTQKRSPLSLKWGRKNIKDKERDKRGRDRAPSREFSSVAQSCLTLQPHESKHTRPPCPSPTPGVHSNSHSLSRWCHPAISSSVVPFFSCPQSLPASEFFPMSQLFAWGVQSTGVSALASFLPKNTQDWSLLEWTGWISLQSKGLSRVFSNTTVQKHQFFSTKLSSQFNSHIHAWLLEKPYPWLDRPLLEK